MVGANSPKLRGSSDRLERQTPLVRIPAPRSPAAQVLSPAEAVAPRGVHDAGPSPPATPPIRVAARLPGRTRSSAGPAGPLLLGAGHGGVPRCSAGRASVVLCCSCATPSSRRAHLHDPATRCDPAQCAHGGLLHHGERILVLHSADGDHRRNLPSPRSRRPCLDVRSPSGPHTILVRSVQNYSRGQASSGSSFEFRSCGRPS